MDKAQLKEKLIALERQHQQGVAKLYYEYAKSHPYEETLADFNPSFFIGDGKVLYCFDEPDCQYLFIRFLK
jgi:hypothetical protein